jgi:hypothetical protein
MTMTVSRFSPASPQGSLVNDIQREFWGKAGIGKWVEAEIFGAKVTMEVVRAVDHYDDLIVTAKLDGDYDKTGLPDPLAPDVLNCVASINRYPVPIGVLYAKKIMSKNIFIRDLSCCDSPTD